MTNIEIGNKVGDLGFALRGREDLLAILGRKNLTREAPMIHTEAKITRRIGVRQLCCRFSQSLARPIFDDSK